MSNDHSEDRRIAEAATKGPWRVQPYLDDKWSERQFGIWADDKPIGTAYWDNAVWLPESESEANATYIAHFSPPHVLALITKAEERDALAEQVRHMRAALEHIAKDSKPGALMFAQRLAATVLQKFAAKDAPANVKE